MFTMFIPILDFNIVKLTRIEQLIESLRNIISYGLSQFLYYLMWGAYQGVNLLFSMIGGVYYSPSLTTSFADAICENMILRWFPGFTRTDDLGTVTPIPYYTYNVMDDVNILTSQVYILIFQIIVILMVVYLILSVIRNDPKHSIKAVGYLNAMIVIPLVLVGIQQMIQVFSPSFTLDGYLFTDPLEPHTLPYPIISNVVYEQITSDFGAFITGNIFQIALSSFIYLEFSFQMSYVYQVTSPTERRASRLKYQIEALKRAATEAVVDIEKIQKKQKEKEEEAEQTEEMDEEGNVKQKKKKTESVRKFLTGGASGFSFISEMIEKRKLEQETKKLIEAKQDTRRLSNYLNKLLENDREAEYTLTARTSAPTAGKLVTSTIADILFRVGGITLLTFLVSQTVWVLVDVLHVPEALSGSVEMLTKEVILTLFIPLVLLFPILSLIIRGVKYSRLQEKLQEEEERTLEAEGFLPSSEETGSEEEEKSEEPPSLEKNKNQNGNKVVTA